MLLLRVNNMECCKRICLFLFDTLAGRSSVGMPAIVVT